MGHDATFRALHAPGELLVLPNAWDAASARLIEEAGAKAIATSSAVVAWAHGVPDGNRLEPGLLAASAARIARAIRVPLSVDAEGGLTDDPAAVAANVVALVDAGAVGINIEDGSGAPELLCRKIEAIRRATSRNGFSLWINARTDVVLAQLVPRAQAAAEIARRAALYRTAGADGLFAPGVSDPDLIAAVVQAAGDMPLNLLAVPGLPGGAELRRLGVRRISAGSGLGSLAYAAARDAARAMLATGDTAALLERPRLEYGPTNALFTRHPEPGHR
jgi:2-methylisocitrate lyase-like PEP mutase family enzyme